MKLLKALRIAFNIILHSKLRSWLTIIGIIIGIGAVVSIVSLGQGAQKTLSQNLNTLSADIITINPGFSRAMGSNADFGEVHGGPPSVSQSSMPSKNLTSKDVTILKSVPNILYIEGIISGSADTSYLGKNAKVQVQGVDPSIWKEMTSSELDYGRYLITGDKNVVVVGSRVANSTFSGLTINRQISIEGKPFNVVGILKESGSGDDSRIMMPIDSAITVLENKNEKNFDSILIKISNVSMTDETIANINEKLMLSHGIMQDKRKDFTVTSMKAMQERISSAIGSMSLFLSAIAAVSLIVGAVGITNSMFTSVLERTREIGILKATGAKNRDILVIFLFNSGIIGLIGGILGVGLGIVLSGLLGQLMTSSSVGRFSLSSIYISPQIIAEVFLLSMIIGLIAGAIPAYRASKMSPVEALRYE